MHHRLRLALITALTVLAIAGARGAQQPAGPALDVEALGPHVGAPVPDFSLPDQHGATRSLKSLMGPKGAILVFFRSADW
jgi:cytochrome oxidase Cu insertion factor (SCO1/SenC/PrrC family)